MAEKGVGLFVGATKRGREKDRGRGRASYRECVNLCKREAMRTPGKRVFTADPVAGGKSKLTKSPAGGRPRLSSAAFHKCV